MDREEIEDLVYASLGRHLRVTCVLGLLFLGIGFVIGHMVAAQHSRALSERWSTRVEQLSRQVAQVEAKLKVGLTKVSEPPRKEQSVPAATTQVSDLTPPVIVTETSRAEELHKAAETHVARVEEQCREQVARCIEETEREKARIQSELQPFLDRKMTIQATIVSQAVNRLLDTQVAHLKTLADEDAPTAQAQDAPYFRSSVISPISAESSPPQTRPSPVAPLLPVPGDQASASEDATLMPLPTTPMERVPVAAEPTRGLGAALEQGQPEAPNQPRRTIFIRSRKPVEVSNEAGTTVQ